MANPRSIKSTCFPQGTWAAGGAAATGGRLAKGAKTARKSIPKIKKAVQRKSSLDKYNRAIRLNMDAARRANSSRNPNSPANLKRIERGRLVESRRAKQFMQRSKMQNKYGKGKTYQGDQKLFKGIPKSKSKAHVKSRRDLIALGRRRKK